MTVAMLLKIFSDCCICFAVLGSGVLPYEGSLVFPALICGLSAAVATFFCEKRWAWARRLCALLPLSCLLLAREPNQMVILIVPIAYTGFVILRGKLELEYYNYRSFFLKSLGLLVAIYGVIGIWKFMSEITQDTPPFLNSSIILRFGLIHSVCGIVLQRQLRLGTDHHAQGSKSQILALAGALAAIVFGFLIAETFMREAALTILKGAVTVILVPLMLLLEGISWLINLLPRRENMIEAPTVSVDSPGMDQIATDPEQTTNAAVENAGALIGPWVVIAVVFLLIAAILMYRSFRKRCGASTAGEFREFLQDEIRRNKKAVRSNRKKVRQIYREFLLTEQGRGLKLRPSDTSEDVLKRISDKTDEPSASRLRQIYLQVRYDGRKPVTRSQLEQAKQALKNSHQK